jgi:hypothetical protein
MEFELENREEMDSPRIGEHCRAVVSIMAPAESLSHSGMVVQWHGGFPGKAEGKEYAQGPEACLRLDNRRFIYQTNYKQSKEAESSNRVETLVEKVVQGQWYDFFFHDFFSLKKHPHLSPLFEPLIFLPMNIIPKSKFLAIQVKTLAKPVWRATLAANEVDRQNQKRPSQHRCFAAFFLSAHCSLGTFHFFSPPSSDFTCGDDG